ncbi:hypothetical protein SAMN05880501_107193 [Ureibacillus xyleni]|uniref:DUF2971 family protein n=1 Tax=Ureibacillus xyleni TaxID=614648 RepID=A0A285SY46_9BACL|nr:DUF2971 domain-containing protein [Ureibacillus xyleni]SOC13456.1 hypothetical protein SAMN05880501_107193 [Ureibacillus xyleni]
MEQNLKMILVNAFWEEMGSIIRSDKLDKKIYHYTSLEGLMGILSSEEVWMTNSDFLNDMSELTYFKTLTKEAKERFETEILFKYKQEEINKNNMLTLFIELFDKAIQNRFDKPTENFEVYVMSLSENDDSLTLWGNYAKGKGYNICFNTQTLISEVDKIGLGYVVYGNVVYERETQLRTLSHSLVRTFDLIINKDVEIGELKKELLSYFNSLIISYSIFFKHASFAPEEEFRMALTTSENVDVQFRSNGEVIIPYIKLEFDKSDINGIVIGPKNNSDIAENGVKTYLQKLNYSLNETWVKKSEIPLRY